MLRRWHLVTNTPFRETSIPSTRGPAAAATQAASAAAASSSSTLSPPNPMSQRTAGIRAEASSARLSALRMWSARQEAHVVWEALAAAQDWRSREPRGMVF